ncbi:hypothetical protein DFH09DRAFT_1096007 [Mycena vulgaris]|nr:hypothetical protein DFH09DRAFT_1096007 [Mycena vulgaris]
MEGKLGCSHVFLAASLLEDDWRVDASAITLEVGSAKVKTDTNFSDVTNAGYLTTLGAASFRGPMQNKIDVEKTKTLIRRGRPPKLQQQSPAQNHSLTQLRSPSITPAQSYNIPVAAPAHSKGVGRIPHIGTWFRARVVPSRAVSACAAS